MKITFSKDNNKTIMVLPYVEDGAVEINYGEASHETFSSFKYGTIVANGAKPLTEISISGVFPNGKENWMESEAIADPMKYKQFFRDALKNGEVLKVALQRSGKSLTMLNINCIITGFTMTAPKRNGDWSYTINLIQYVKLSTKR